MALAGHLYFCLKKKLIPFPSKGVLQPIQVIRFLVKAARPPTLDMTTVFVLVCSPPVEIIK